MDQRKIGGKGWKKKSTASEIYEIPLSITNIRLEFHNERRQRPKEKKNIWKNEG